MAAKSAGVSSPVVRLREQSDRCDARVPRARRRSPQTVRPSKERRLGRTRVDIFPVRSRVSQARPRRLREPGRARSTRANAERVRSRRRRGQSQRRRSARTWERAPQGTGLLGQCNADTATLLASHRWAAAKVKPVSPLHRSGPASERHAVSSRDPFQAPPPSCSSSSMWTDRSTHAKISSASCREQDPLEQAPPGGRLQGGLV